MKKYMKKRNNFGFTLIEVLVAAVILGIAVYIWIGGITSMFPIFNRGKDRFNLAIEQRAVVNLLESVSISAVQGALCYDANAPTPAGYPHPYGKLSYDGSCQILRAWTPSEKLAWQDLADAVMGWQGASTGTTLNSTYFTSTIQPKLVAASCAKCHAGGYPKTYNVNTPPIFPAAYLDNTYMNTNRPDISHRDFTNLSDLTADPFLVGTAQYKPLATRAILASPLAQMFFQNEFEIQKVIPGSTYLIKHHISFKVEKTNISIPSYNSVAKIGNFCSPTSGGSSSVCGVPPPTACNTSLGEVYDGSSCKCNCTYWNPPPVCSCGKGCVMICPGAVPTCANWETTYSCLSTSKVQTVVITGENGHLPTTANFISPQLQSVPDTYCATGLNAGPQCSGVVCGAGATGTSCIAPGSCQRMCTGRTWSNPVVCGKGCVIPPQPTDCIEQKVQYDCHYPLPSGVTQTSILSYTLNSQLFDGTTPIADLVTTGVLR